MSQLECPFLIDSWLVFRGVTDMAPNKGSSTGKTAAKAAKKAKQADKAAKKEALVLRSAAVKGKGKAVDDDEDLEAILQRYQEEMQAVSLLIPP